MFLAMASSSWDNWVFLSLTLMYWEKLSLMVVTASSDWLKPGGRAKAEWELRKEISAWASKDCYLLLSQCFCVVFLVVIVKVQVQIVRDLPGQFGRPGTFDLGDGLRSDLCPSD